MAAPSNTTGQHGPDDLQPEVKQFIENLSIVLADEGMSRMGARVLAAITCYEDEDGPTQADLAAILSASPAAISTATRELISTGHIQKISLPRERADRYQLVDVIQSTIDLVVSRHRRIAQAYRCGLELFKSGTRPHQTMLSNYTFHNQFANMAAAIPQMLAHQQPGVPEVKPLSD